MKRIIFHWTAGGPKANKTDLKHYHEVINQDLTISLGTHSISDNVSTADGVYAAHTRNLNTGSIGLSCAGMAGAKESPLNVGKYPVTEEQFDRMAARAAELCRQYSIPVLPTTTLTHAEVQGTLGVVQRNKWDYTVLPWRNDIRGAQACGDYLRDRIRYYLNDDVVLAPEPAPSGDGARNRIRWLQKLLIGKGYDGVGEPDGWMGPKTRGALYEFQGANDLPLTGTFDPATVEALRTETITVTQAKRSATDIAMAAIVGGVVSAAAGAWGVIDWIGDFF